jgi:hypothetical protein
MFSESASQYSAKTKPNLSFNKPHLVTHLIPSHIQLCYIQKGLPRMITRKKAELEVLDSRLVQASFKLLSTIHPALVYLPSSPRGRFAGMEIRYYTDIDSTIT